MFNTKKVGTRLYALIGFLSVLLIVIGVIGLQSTKQSHDGLNTVYNDRVIPLKGLKVIADMYAVNIVDISHKVRNGNLQWDEGRKNVAVAVETIDKKWSEYLATSLVPEEQKLINEIMPLMKTANSAVTTLTGILQREDHAALTEFTISELYPTIDPVSGKFSELVDIQLAVAKEEYDKVGMQLVQPHTISGVEHTKNLRAGLVTLLFRYGITYQYLTQY